MKYRFFALLLLLNTIGHAQSTKFTKIDSFINYLEANKRDIGSVSIFQKGQEVYNKSFGQKGVQGLTFDQNTSYRIGSISKVVTATLIFKLIEMKKLNLDTKLSEFYKDMPNAYEITIKNLLEHSSGLGDFAAKDGDYTWLMNKVEKEDILQEIRKQGVHFKPGTDVDYSNSGYFLLARIVEKLYGDDYPDLVEKYIAKPLGLKNFKSNAGKNDNFFQSYEYTDGWNKIEEFEFSNVIGVGDIIATTKDLNVFLTNLFQYKIVSKESIEIMKPLPGKSIGRGLMLVPFYEMSFYGHGGDTYGTHSMVAYDEQTQTAIAYSINGERFGHNNFALGILSLFFGKNYDFPEFTKFEVSAEALSKYIGTYSNASLPIKLTISVAGNSLQAQGTDQPSFTLDATTADTFTFDPAGVKIKFVADGKLMLYQGGAQFEMTRE